MKKLTAVQVWREKSRERLRSRAVPLELPSGMIVRIARPPLENWIGTSRLPEALAKDVIAACSELDDEKRQDILNDLGEERAGAVLGFIHTLSCESVVGAIVESRERPIKRNAEGRYKSGGAEVPLEIVMEDPGDDQILLADVPDDDAAWIVAQALEGVPGQPVALEGGGEVGVAALKSARTGKRGAGNRAHRRAVRSKARKPVKD